MKINLSRQCRTVKIVPGYVGPTKFRCKGSTGSIFKEQCPTHDWKPVNVR